jgi:hypothetical protein
MKDSHFKKEESKMTVLTILAILGPRHKIGVAFQASISFLHVDSF